MADAYLLKPDVGFINEEMIAAFWGLKKDFRAGDSSSLYLFYTPPVHHCCQSELGTFNAHQGVLIRRVCTFDF